MKIHLTIIFLLITPFLFAQVNLVPNPSFEDTVACPSNSAQINNAVGWINFGVTPDYFNACSTSPFVSVPNNWAGYQQPASGNAYAAIYTEELPNINGREYIGTELSNTLQINKTYYISFKASLGLGGVLKPNCATNKLGALFTTYPFYYDGNPPNAHYYVKNFAHIFTNQLITDSIGWRTISDSVVADSAYQYVVIGNFFVDSLTSYLKYFDNGYSECASYYFIDDIYVGESPDAISENNSKSKTFNIYPNPATNELTIDFALTDKSYFELYDVIGAKRKAVTLDIGTQTKRIDLTDIDSGLYFYSVVDRKGIRIKTDKLVVIK